MSYNFSRPLILICTAMTLSGCEGPSPSTASDSINEIVSEGDAAFNSDDYEGATQSYAQAISELDAILDFEKHSPSSDSHFVQDLYNKRAVIRMKLDIAEIGLGVRKLSVMRQQANTRGSRVTGQ